MVLTVYINMMLIAEFVKFKLSSEKFTKKTVWGNFKIF